MKLVRTITAEGQAAVHPLLEAGARPWGGILFAIREQVPV